MHCEELTEDLLLDIADRRAQGAPVEHLGRCPPCAERFLQTSRVYEMATVALQSTPPPALDARILRAIPVRSAPRRMIPALAASLVFSVACAWAVLSLQPPPWPQHARALLPAPATPEIPALVSVETDPADLNGDGRVDIADLMLLYRRGVSPDLNRDGKVDVADTMLLLRPGR